MAQAENQKQKTQQLSNEIEALKKLVEEKELCINELRQKTESTSKEEAGISNASSEVDDLLKKVTVLQAEKDSIKAALDTEQSKYTQAQQQNTELAVKEKEAREKGEKLEKQLLEQKNKLQEELNDAQGRLSLKDKEVIDIKAKLDAAEKKEQEQALELARKQKEIQDERNKTELEAKDKQAKVSAFEAKEREMLAKMKDTETQLQDTKEKLAAAKAEADLLKKMNSTPQNKPSSACSVQ